jgi:hypothetical protein
MTAIFDLSLLEEAAVCNVLSILLEKFSLYSHWSRMTKY